MSNHFSSRVLSTEFIVSLQIALVGFLVTEVWYLAKAIGESISAYILIHNAQVYVCPAILIIIVILTLYIFLGDIITEITRFKRSKRYSALGFVLVGILISASVEGVGSGLYQNLVERLGGVQLMLIAFIPVLFYIGFVLTELFKKKHEKQVPLSFFINDQAIEFADEDLLDVKNNAVKFAEQVLNNGASDSLVFGVDSAWGVGKSSFINLCSNYWSEQNDSNVIVVRFEPLRYKESADLVDAYVNELVIAIQNHVFAPTVQNLFYKYLKLVKGVRTSSILGVNLTIERPTVSAHEILDNISCFLSKMDMRIIVVVDDLDRLSWAEVKKILFSIKRSFMLPNVSYVLCYDTENFSKKGKEAEEAGKVKEFLEKYVNIKISLFLSSNTLSKYVSENTEGVLRKNLHLDPRTRANIEGTISWLKIIYSSKGFYRYANLVGDIRKLKRLINTLLSLGIYSTDYDNTDYDKGDLLHLLLIYINFPHIFRDIYNAETDGKNGAFSLTYDLMGNDKFGNSDEYNTYIESLSDDQKLLLSQLFDAGRIGKNKFISACYNGEGYTERNLERYLKLIVNQIKQDKLDSYQFYVAMKDKFIQGKSLDEIFSMEELGFSNGDFVRREFWNIVSNSSSEITPSACKEAISHILEYLPDYSFLNEKGVSADTRVSLIYVLLHLFDDAAWKTEGSRGSVTNSNERVKVIADWVFGEDGYSDKGVISTLSQADRGVLGLHDLLLFRLYCSADY